jgi:hypothetical protein
MAEIPLPGRDSIDAQAEMFRRAASEHGLTLNVLSQRSPIALSTLRGWSYGAAMPAWSIGCLAEAGIPDDLLSLLLEPFARHVGSDGNTEVMFDHAAADAMAFATQASAARSPDSPGGTETGRIGPVIDAVSPEGTRGALLPLLSCTTATVPAKSSSAGKSLQ